MPTDEELRAWAAEICRGLPKMSAADCKAIGDIYDQIDARRAEHDAKVKEAA
jgi:hypothetical protein